MSHTPTKAGSARNLPMIVDIAIGNDGKQLYQVHESTKLVRKEMPRSTNFSVLTAPADEEKTPIRKILGTILPSTLNQKRAESEFDAAAAAAAQPFAAPTFMPPPPPEQAPFAGLPAMAPARAPFQYATPYQSHFAPPSGGGYHGASEALPLADTNDIWSADVEAAFEEILSIIPKNGLSKIKISGRLCGRNELISDYILQKTGKFRTRKQVSSHIQVIKNLGQRADIIKLIHEGPVFATDHERDANMAQFEQIFLRITLAKSLGGGEAPQRAMSLPNAAAAATAAVPAASSPRKRRRTPVFEMDDFFMSIQELAASPPVALTRQPPQPMATLVLKEDAILAHRFPGLRDFTALDIPFVHNMVHMKVPRQSAFECLTARAVLRSDGAPGATHHTFSCVYLFGQEVLKTNEPQPLNTSSDFMLKFWNFFFKELLAKSQSDISTALRGVTIKQIVYADAAASSNPKSTRLISKLKVQAVVLWEFAAVEHYHEAVTTSLRLTLPRHTQSADIVPQLVERHGPYAHAHPEPLSSNYSPTPHTTFLPAVRSAASHPGYLPVPQLSVQHKFQALQDTHAYAHPPPFVPPAVAAVAGQPYLHLAELGFGDPHAAPAAAALAPAPAPPPPHFVPYAGAPDAHTAHPYQFGGLLVNPEHQGYMMDAYK